MPPDDQSDWGEIQRENERLRADLELERRRAAENEARADNLDQQVSQSSARIHSAQLAQLTAQEQAADDAIRATENEITGLKTRLATLQAEGKFEDAADVQVAIGDATARRQQAAQAKGYFSQQKATYSAAPVDPVERFLTDNQGQYSQEDMDWIRRNRRFATDTAFRNRVIQAHNEAIHQRGIQQRSPDYYRFVESAAYLRGAPGMREEIQQPEPPPAPTGYEPQEPEQPEIRIIREPEMDQAPPPGEAYMRRAETPQARAAGPGSLRGVAGAPSRRSPDSNGRRTILQLTEGERDSALAMAPHLMGEQILRGGEPAILNEYNNWKNSAIANRIRQGWLDRR